MPKVSIILVNYNGRVWLPGCLESLRQQQWPDYEIILVDNASTDDSRQFVRAEYPEVKLILSDTNRGFAGGNNLGLQQASGEYILLLNTDTIVTVDFLPKLLEAFTVIPHLGCVQPKLLFMHEPHKLDSCGSYFTATGFLQHIGNQQPANTPEFNQPLPVFSVKGACMMFRRDILEKTGGLFDEDYWCYFEETDFCWRVWLAGYECWYYPKAVIQHAMGGSSGYFIANDFVQYHSLKNRLVTYLKNLSPRKLLIVLPFHLAINWVLSGITLLSGQWRNTFVFYRALWYTIVHLPSILRKRRTVQCTIRRRVDDGFLRQVSRSVGLRDLWHRLIGFIHYERDKRPPIGSR